MEKSKKLAEKNIEDIFALTPMQQGMLYHYLKDPQSDLYFEQLSLAISGEIDKEIFEKACNFVVDTNEMLRTLFRWEKMKHPTQVVLKKHYITLLYHDFSNMHRSEKEKLSREIKINDRKKKFDLREVPLRITLYKMEKNRYEMIISNHHILYDGWSNGIILQEFFNTYNDFSKGKELIKPVKTKFKEFIKWGQTLENIKEERFWRDYLKGFDTPTELSIKRRRKTGKIKNTGKYQVIVDKDRKDGLDSFIKEHKITLASLLYTAWGLLLQKYNNTGDVIFGTTVSGRSANIKGIEDIIGLFINTLPFRMQTNLNEKIINHLHRGNESLQIRKKYEYSSLVKIKEYSELGNNEAFFDTIVVIENYPLQRHLLQKSENSKLSLNSYSIFEMTNYDLTVAISTAGNIEVDFIYNQDLFDQGAIRGMAGHFISLLGEITRNQHRSAAEIEIIPGEEKKKLLYEFNNTMAEYPKDKAIHQLFEYQVERTPDHVGLVAHSAGRKAQGEKRRSTQCAAMRYALSYKELNRKSNQLTCLLKQKGTQPDTIVGIMVERSVEMVIGILGILKAGGAYLPIDLNYPGERIRFMLKNSQAKILLTTKNIAKAINSEKEMIYLDSPLPPFPPSTLPSTHLHLPSAPATAVSSSTSTSTCQVSPTNLAYIIYTSGSTGKPKGVMVEHRSIVNVLTALQKQYPLKKSHTYLFKTSYVFDVSVTELFGWFWEGGRLTILEKNGEKDPLLIMDTIEKECVTHINFVPSMFNVFVDFLNPGNINRLSGLRYIFLAGEALFPQVVNKFGNLGSDIRLENIYGPTEATIYASKYPLSKWDGVNHISIGKPVQNLALYILDNYNHLQPIGIMGELCIGGVGLARGYLNNPELTAERFIELEVEVEVEEGEAPFGQILNASSEAHPLRAKLYHTGDLARWLADGNIEFLGRMDHQVKIRGFRIEPGEIEKQLLNHNKIKEAVVVTKPALSPGEQYLCAYIVPHLDIDNTGLREYLSRALPGYMIPPHFVTMEKLPLTPSGKLDRKSLPEPVLEAGTGYTAPRDEVERKLVEIWGDLLGIDIQHDVIGIDDNFFELGGHSLKATIMISRIHKAFNVKLPLGELFKNPSIRKLSKYIQTSAPDQFKTIKAVEKKDYYPLASAQKRLYILDQMESASTGYNITGVFLLEQELDPVRLDGVFRNLINRHKSFRVSFLTVAEEPVQLVHDEVEYEIEYDCAERTAQSTIKNFVRPFDLSHAPLLRVGLLKTGEEKYFLVVDMHHIISDGLSIAILQKEMADLYNLEELPPLRIQYKDYSEWQKGEIDRGKLRQQGAYWLKEFGEEIPVLDLPYDYVRPSIQGFAGKTVHFEVGSLETNALKDLGQKENTTLYMVILAIYNILLGKLSNKEDIVVGTPAAGRQHADLEHVVGMFVNTLALQNHLGKNETFTQFLEKVKEKTLIALENQDYPFEELVERLVINRDASRNPLFDVMFVFQDFVQAEPMKTHLEMTPIEYEKDTAKFYMTLVGELQKEKLLFTLEYSTKLFKEETILRFTGYFKQIIDSILENSHREISGIEIISEQEKRQLLVDFNAAAIEFPENKTIPGLFTEQVEKTPDHIAVSIKDKQLTYQELKKNTNGLAHLLRNRGIKPDNIVGIIVKRSLEMVIGIMGILKAGGAYLPIEPEYPEERIRFMLENSESKILLTPGKYSQSVVFAGKMIDVQLGMNYRENDNLEPMSKPENLLYLIYTSGSTGRPKGAMVKIKSFMNLLNWYREEFNINPRDNVLLMASLSFDLAQKNLFVPLITGARLCLPSCRLHHYDELSPLVAKEQITLTNCAPSVFYPLVESNQDSDFIQLKSLREVFLGGESIHTNKLRPWINSESCGCEIVNTYGPTECTDIASFYRISREEINRRKNIPIGKPIHNVKLFVLDKNQLILPIGVAGELCIGGISLGIGYYNNELLTEEKFIEVVHLPEKKIYRTGDLTRWLPDGNIEFLGRIDHQIKIRGYRIEPGEIENHLLMHPEIKEAVVLTKENDNGDKTLCAYIVPVREHRDTELREYLSGKLPTYMIPSYFVTMENLPLTPSGKLDRKSLPEPVLNAGSGYTAPRDEVERKLVEIWADLLGIDVQHDVIGIDDNFFELGGHSLKATIMISKIHQEFNVSLTIAEMFTNPIIRNLALYIKEKRRQPGDTFTSIEPAEKKEFYPLSPAQSRLFVIQQLESRSTTYNVSTVVVLEREIHWDNFENSFKKLTQRHEILRTSFIILDGQPVQKVHDEVEFAIEYHDEERHPLCAMPHTGTMKKFVRPFELSQAPLLRVGLIKTKEDRYILMADMHHIITDGTSTGILITDLVKLYQGEKLPKLKYQYKDFSQWQKNRILSGEMKKQEEYWLEQFKGKFPGLKIPFDFPRPTIRNNEGRTIGFEITHQETEKLKKLAKKENTTMFTLILALFNVLLYKITYQDDINVGTVLAGRRHADLANIMGIFVNTIVLRNFPGGDRTLSKFLRDVRKRTLEAFDNQDYQFEDLVEKLKIKREPGRNPLFDVLFTFASQAPPRPASKQPKKKNQLNLAIKPYGEKESAHTKFDLFFFGEEAGNTLSFRMQYSIELFKKKTIEKFIKYFKEIVSTVVENEAVKLRDIKIIHDLKAASSDIYEDNKGVEFEF